MAYSTNWPSGMIWIYTVWHPTIFWIQGEFLYLFLILLFFPSMKVLGFIGLALVVVMIAKLMGYSLGGLFRRWNRWRLGRARSIYCVSDNLNRIIKGV